ncbi:RNA polymerase sigma-70 factor [Larkinella bovis]|uniref:RNA polymerase sigma-70 factor n=1 Tax=Larkinella bovis TaxID=683041 RepID=A0ABW0IHD1_9BACT
MNRLTNSGTPFQPDNQYSLPTAAEGVGSESGQTKVLDSELFIRRTFETDPEKGYQLLFKRYYHPLCNQAVRFVYAKEVAEDLVVDIFAQIWHKKLYQSITVSYRAYLFTAVRHAAFAHLRSEFGRTLLGEECIETENDPEINTAQTPQQILVYNELYLKIEEIIRSVPAQSQKVFIMSRFEGKKNARIAEELNLSVKTVEGHITKVLTILRQSLRAQGFFVLAFLSFFYAAQQGVRPFFSLLRIAISTLL